MFICHGLSVPLKRSHVPRTLLSSSDLLFICVLSAWWVFCSIYFTSYFVVTAHRLLTQGSRSIFKHVVPLPCLLATYCKVEQEKVCFVWERWIVIISSPMAVPISFVVAILHSSTLHTMMYNVPHHQPKLWRSLAKCKVLGWNTPCRPNHNLCLRGIHDLPRW